MFFLLNSSKSAIIDRLQRLLLEPPVLLATRFLFSFPDDTDAFDGYTQVTEFSCRIYSLAAAY